MAIKTIRTVVRLGQSSSLFAIVVFAAIALVAIFGVLLWYSWDSLVGLVKRRQDNKNEHHPRAFFHTQLGAYIAALMLSNALSSVSFVINAEWAVEGVVREEILCNTQGILAQLGDVGGAYFTGTIAIHTFNTLVLRNKVGGWVCLATVFFGFLVAVLLAATPFWIHTGGLSPVYGFNGVSCGISNKWPVVNTLLRVLPLLLGSVVSVLFYTLAFLVLRGTLRIKNGFKFNVDRTHRWSMSSVASVEYQRYIAVVARRMLWFPFAYNILLLPEIIVSLSRSSGIIVPFEVSVFSASFASLLGIANALILANTWRVLRPFMEGNLAVGSHKESKETDMESFFAGAKSPTFTVSPSTPKNPERAFINKRDSDSKREWIPPPRGTVARSIDRVSRAVSLKRKDSRTKRSVAFEEIARPITPIAELNAMITLPEQSRRKPMLPSTPRLAGASPGLPAPRRDTRSPLIRQPTLPTTPGPSEPPFTPIDLNASAEPPKKSTASSTAHRSGDSRQSANDSLLSMYLSRSPDQPIMEKPAPPPKPAPSKPRPQPIPLSARPPSAMSSIAPSPLPSLRSARVPVPTYTPDGNSLPSNGRTERTRPTPANVATTKAERRRSRSLDLSIPTPTPLRTPALASARTPVYGNLLTASATATPTPRRDASLSAVSLRTPTSARRLAMTPSSSRSTTPAPYGYL